MKILAILPALVAAALVVACGESEVETVVTPITLSVTATPDSATPDPATPELTPEAATTAPDPEATPTPVPTHFQDPSEQDVKDAVGIYEALPKPLPANERYEILYDPVPGPGGIFTIVIIGVEPGDEDSYRIIVEEALQWFRNFGFEPCDAPLAGVIAITGFYWEGPPPDDHIVWEPC